MAATRRTGSHLRLIVFGALAVLLASACSSSSKLPPNVMQAGQVDIQLPPGWKVTHNGVVSPNQPGSGASAVAAGGGPTTTIPLNKQNPATKFFQATATFSSCLKGLGVTFIGAPDPSNPNSPANSPNYLKSLETCAAQSHILQALKDFQKLQDSLTPAQIQVENKQYLKWRTCMIGRGWTVPQPTPDNKGRLFSLNTGGSSTGPQLVPPPGQSLFNSSDIQDCVKQSFGGSSGLG